jgi:hypothetical protein
MGYSALPFLQQIETSVLVQSKLGLGVAILGTNWNV